MHIFSFPTIICIYIDTEHWPKHSFNRGRRQKALCFIKYFNTFKYDHILYRGRKHFCRYCLQVLKQQEHWNVILKIAKDYTFKKLLYFQINGKQKIKMPKKYEYIRFKNYKRKIKLLFMIYADFESIIVPKDNGKQNPRECYTSKYQKLVLACTYG